MKDVLAIILTKDEMTLIQYGTNFSLSKDKTSVSGDEFIVTLSLNEIDALMETLGMEKDHAGTAKTKKAFKSLYQKLERILQITDD